MRSGDFVLSFLFQCFVQPKVSLWVRVRVHEAMVKCALLHFHKVMRKPYLRLHREMVWLGLCVGSLVTVAVLLSA